ncbi:MAG: SRPBCC family protein [Spirochaetes bacterium]|nr:SRPBCC family protein [Spirochaetota bacterium]
MKLIKKIAVVFTILLAAFFVAGILLPSRYSTQRSIKINAPINKVFENVNNLKKNMAWSPWKQNDPTFKITLGKKYIGLGASYSWVSKDSGEGLIKITESIKNKSIRVLMDFKTQGKAEGYWIFKKSDNATIVTEGFIGNANGNIIAKYFGLFIDSYLGSYIDIGLKRLKRILEGK